MTLYDNDLNLIFSRSLAHLGWSTKSDGEASTIRGGGPRHQKWRSTDREFTKANILFDLGAEIAEMKRSLEARAKGAPKWRCILLAKKLRNQRHSMASI